MEHTRQTSAEEELHQELSKLARKHIGGVLGLQLLPYKPETYPEQALGRTYRDVDPDTTLDTVRLIAGMALGGEKTRRFEQLTAGFMARPDMLNNIRMDLADGRNIALITDHSSLEGIAYAQAALISALGDKDLLHNNGIILSKLLTRLSVFGGQPATDILSKLGRSLFSVPRSKSIFRSGIDNDIATQTNEAMLLDLDAFLRPGGRIVALAPSGSLDERRFHRGQLQSLTLQRMSSGTAHTLAKFDRILPAALWLEASASHEWFAIGSLTDTAKGDPAGAHRQMEWLADAVSGLARVPAEYEKERMTGIERARELGREALENAQRLRRERPEKDT
jgi:hypothetical protein